MVDFGVCVPNINSDKYSDDDKFKLIKNCFSELVEMLGIVLSQLDTDNLSETLASKINAFGETALGTVKLKEEVARKFADIRDEIVTAASEIRSDCSADMERTEDSILQTVRENFAAKSEFGEFRTQTQNELELNTRGIELNAGEIMSVETDLEAYKISNNAEFGVQNDAILSQVESHYAKKNDIDDLNETVSSKILQTTSDITEQFNVSVERLADDLTSLGGKTTELISSLNAYIRRGELEDGVFGIEIGKSDSQIKARFTNDRMAFMRGDYEIAYISGNDLYITRAEILDYLKIGNTSEGYFIFDVTENGLEVRWMNGG